MKIFSIVLILIFMAEATWGLLSKSAVDNETVEQAIARLIAVHEAAETSHLGVGESLETHKASEIIDHPAGSVVGDKVSAVELIWTSNFADHALWTKVDVHDYDWPGMSIPESGGTGVTSVLWLNIQNVIGNALPWTVDFFWQSKIMFYELTDTSYGRIGFGITTNNQYNGFGFKTSSAGVKAYVRINGSDTESAVLGVSWDTEYMARCIYMAADNKVYFYLNGVEVASIARPAGSAGEYPSWGFKHTGGSGAGYTGGIWAVGVMLTLR